MEWWSNGGLSFVLVLVIEGCEKIEDENEDEEENTPLPTLHHSYTPALRCPHHRDKARGKPGLVTKPAPSP
jgi:hypothetical protein